ncbi:DUF6308 family protein [Corynebacterium lipophiloflavum]|nr:DUF6308 family protein [Corynebacterium lipophiloflavum]
MALRLPASLGEAMAGNPAPAESLLRRYYRSRLEGDRAGLGSQPWYSGAYYDEWSTDAHPKNATVFTPEDVLAVSYLSVRIPGRAVADILHRRRDELNQALFSAVQACEGYASLGDVPRDVTSYTGNFMALPDTAWAPFVLERKLREIDKIGVVTASKLIARKLPRIYPINDQHVKALTGVGNQYMRPLHLTLADNPRIEQTLETVRRSAGLPVSISALRVFDVLAWMEQTDLGRIP